MKRIINLALLVFLSAFLYNCEEEDVADESLPLSGSYLLTNMTISTVATSINDTTLTLLEPVNGSTTYFLPANTVLMTEYAEYSNQDSVPISGEVNLENDGSATLGGLLPVNWGSGCNPFLLISSLASDGNWAADTSSGTFSIDLVVDALDIDGSYAYVGDQLEIRYSILYDEDQRMVDSIPVNGTQVAIETTCIAVSTVTERVLLMSIEN
jgi:hypothetical protein